MMQNLAQTGRDAVLLRDWAFVGLRDSTDNFRRGLQLLVAVSLIVGLIISVAGFIQEATAPPPSAQIDQAQQQVRQMFSQFSAFGSPWDDPEFQRLMLDNVDAGFRIGTRVSEVVQQTTPLGGPISNLFEAIGRLVSYPFRWISTWMWYTLLVLVFAKLLGGTATLQEMLGTTSLVAVPHLLDLFGFVPFIGVLLGVVAFFWGLVVYVKATAVANRFSMEKGLVAVLLPVIVLTLLVAMLVTIFIVWIVVTSRGS
ncbi:MAG: hypothetical protein A2Z04_00485 [Chloroflexi bacterium RBG_16_57_9]|nr:MAG: hypothetical protein A2Z04_00485 [Chloroflexi bacterium RBG_16_57_9]